jgi:hypothetical protein
MFGMYVAALYGGAALHGDLNGWNAVMTHGYVNGQRLAMRPRALIC